MKKIISITLLLLVVLLVGCQPKNNITGAAGIEVTMYKSPTCGCCVGHGEELGKNGFAVEAIHMEDLSPIKAKYNIPYSMQSCHTSIIGDYFVEGHVPIEAINKLLEEQPEIDGIALPRMPSGSPGMPGPKTETWIIYSLTNGEFKEFMRI